MKIINNRRYNFLCNLERNFNKMVKEMVDKNTKKLKQDLIKECDSYKEGIKRVKKIGKDRKKGIFKHDCDIDGHIWTYYGQKIKRDFDCTYIYDKFYCPHCNKINLIEEDGE